MPERSIVSESFIAKDTQPLPWGIVLTAGSQIKTGGGYRIEPDLEGKMRSLAALQDLATGRIHGILVAGGARNYGRPLAEIYTNYLVPFLNRYNFSPDQIVEVKGGVNTPSDLRKTTRFLRRVDYHGDIILYSSSYQFERRAIKRFIERFELGRVSLEPAETKILERHRFYGAYYGRYPYLGSIAERILTAEFVEAMRIRNQDIDRFPESIEYAGAYSDRVVKPEIKNHPRLAAAAGIVGVLACALLYRRATSRAKQAI